MKAKFDTYADFSKRYPIQFGDAGTLLGSGTYGRVVKVEDQVETEWVAVKISECRPDDRKSLKAEVELARKLPRHTNIARYDACFRLRTDVGDSDFAIMKYYPDGNLADLLRRERLGDAQLRELVRGILEGMNHLHKHRIVHRDFKPANILISRDNRGRLIPKIADFGLSKVVDENDLLSSDFDLSDGRGTPAYKAPEQITGGTVSFNLDLWAFGVILYEMMTGEKPFDVRTAGSDPSQRWELERRIVSVELPERLDAVPQPYQRMIRRCLVKNIRERARKPTELLDLLEVPTTPVAPVQPTHGEVPPPVYTSGDTPPVGESADEPTDVFGGTLPIGGPDKPPPAPVGTGIPSLRSLPGWLPVALGVVLVVGGVWVGTGEADSASGITSPVDSARTALAVEEGPGAGKTDLKETSEPIIKSTLVTVPEDKNQRTKEEPRSVERPEKTKVPPERVNEALLQKQQAQKDYEGLIQQGVGLIDSRNNKAEAIKVFREAGQLAAVHQLDTRAGQQAYDAYFNKGSRIFDNNGYEGAEAWFRVAQSLRATVEVREKIKECEINQKISN